MTYRILADLLVVFHLAFLLFVSIGGVLVLWRRRVALLHVPAVIWGVFIELSGGVCPLTPMEVRFRALGGEAGYSGSFMDRYVVPILYPPGLTREAQIVLGLLVAAVNLGIYVVVLGRWWRDRRAGGPDAGSGRGA